MLLAVCVSSTDGLSTSTIHDNQPAEDVLLQKSSIVAFKALNISQGSVATHLRCGGIFSDSNITNFLLILRVR